LEIFIHNCFLLLKKKTVLAAGVAAVNKINEELGTRHHDPYVRGAYLSQHRAIIYSEINAAVEKINKEKDLLLPTIVGAPKRPQDIVKDVDSYDYDEDAM